jgi:catechol 2,3-dioxygenase-like lactoylglutathione lyase family enzyme
MIIDHFGIGVSDYNRAKAFYTEALAPLAIALVMEVTPEQTGGKVYACGFGKNGKPELWIGSDGQTTPPVHLAIVVETRAEVRAFYEAALRAGGRDNGKPGLRPHYHPNYYGAFVFDLDGHNIERRSATSPNDRRRNLPATTALGPLGAKSANRRQRRCRPKASFGWSKKRAPVFRGC